MRLDLYQVWNEGIEQEEQWNDAVKIIDKEKERSGGFTADLSEGLAYRIMHSSFIHFCPLQCDFYCLFTYCLRFGLFIDLFSSRTILTISLCFIADGNQ